MMNDFIYQTHYGYKDYKKYDFGAVQEICVSVYKASRHWDRDS